MFGGERFVKTKGKLNHTAESVAFVSGVVIAIPAIMLSTRALYTEIKIDNKVDFDFEPAETNKGPASPRFDEATRILIVPNNTKAKLIFKRSGENELSKQVLVEDTDKEVAIKMGEGMETMYRDGRPTVVRFKKLHNILKVKGNKTEIKTIGKGIILEVTHVMHRYSGQYQTPLKK